METKKLDLDVTIKRKIMGEKRELETLPGFYIRPKKYSYAGAEEIQAVEFEIGKGKRNPVVAKYAKKFRKQGIDKLTFKEVAEKLDEEELAELINATGSKDLKLNAELQEKIMLHGIGEHDFNQNGKMLDIKEAIPILTQDAEAVGEITEIIREWNSPLALEPSEKSETQQKVSTKEQST